MFSNKARDLVLKKGEKKVEVHFKILIKCFNFSVHNLLGDSTNEDILY